MKIYLDFVARGIYLRNKCLPEAGGLTLKEIGFAFKVLWVRILSGAKTQAEGFVETVLGIVLAFTHNYSERQLFLKRYQKIISLVANGLTIILLIPWTFVAPYLTVVLIF